jgi:hypothetical protein
VHSDDSECEGRPGGVRGGGRRALAGRGRAHRGVGWQLALTGASGQSRRELSALPHTHTHRVRARGGRGVHGAARRAGRGRPGRWARAGRGGCAAPAGRGGAAVGARLEPISVRSRHLHTGRGGSAGGRQRRYLANPLGWRARRWLHRHRSHSSGSNDAISELARPKGRRECAAGRRAACSVLGVCSACGVRGALRARLARCGGVRGGAARAVAAGQRAHQLAGGRDGWRPP